jgi:hypothetical protein
LRKSLADNPKTLRLVKLTESSIRKLEPDLVKLKPGTPDYQQVMMTLAPLQEPLSYSLASVMQNNINVYTGNDAFWPVAQCPAVHGVGAGGVRHSAQRPAGARSQAPFQDR